MKSNAEQLAFEDFEFLRRDELRPLRLQLELAMAEAGTIDEADLQLIT